MRTGHCITSSAPGPTCQGVRMQAQAGCCIDHDSCTADGRDLAAQQHRSTLAAQASRPAPHSIRPTTASPHPHARTYYKLPSVDE